MHMVSLNIRLPKNFRRDWIVGLTNQRTSNLIDHPTSDAYKAAIAKLKVKCSRARVASSLAPARYQARARGESAATSITIGHFCHWWMTKRERRCQISLMCVLHDGRRKLTVHQISHVVRTQISPWSWFEPSVLHARLSKGLPKCIIKLWITLFSGFFFPVQVLKGPKKPVRFTK